MTEEKMIVGMANRKRKSGLINSENELGRVDQIRMIRINGGNQIDLAVIDPTGELGRIVKILVASKIQEAIKTCDDDFAAL
ncbi:hypothetical protein [Bacilliculturomica massiliensis]|uniref:hypothetical protein n=1 Tax=Bacilliculturomica massiliensis TaxID=1917867 RepID=UPI00102F95CD|nr:hypothetical protein [Bacilliculturomica massiliensis]